MCDVCHEIPVNPSTGSREDLDSAGLRREFLVDPVFVRTSSR